jgi:hypothetical protein
MKTTTTKQTSLTTYPFGKSKLVQDRQNDQELLSFPDFTLSPPMTEKEIAPPLHVWERIANVLDEQDKQKQMLRTPQPFQSHRNRSPRKLVFAGMAVTVVAGVVWLLS